MRKQHEYDLSEIGNADQTPVTFDLPSNTTVHTKGDKCITINTKGNEKNRFTVMLACTADSGKLPSYVVFKRKTLPKGVKWSAGIIVRCQEKGWMNENLIQDWVKTVWAKRTGGLTKKSLLVLDAFRAHRSKEIKRKVSEDHRTTLTIILGGMTSILQPLDISVNKQMKTILQRKWTEWYASGEHSFTTLGKMRKPELQEICACIVSAWVELDPVVIVRGFKKCCISNSMDGSEDDILFEEFIQKRVSTRSDGRHRK